MSREYKLVLDNMGYAEVHRVYNEPGVSWREVKKQLRQYYLDKASAVREMRPQDAFDAEILETVEEEVEVPQGSPDNYN